MKYRFEGMSVKACEARSIVVLHKEIACRGKGGLDLLGGAEELLGCPSSKSAPNIK